jgi:hypothetical protein
MKEPSIRIQALFMKNQLKNRLVSLDRTGLPADKNKWLGVNKGKRRQESIQQKAALSLDLDPRVVIGSIG